MLMILDAPVKVAGVVRRLIVNVRSPYKGVRVLSSKDFLTGHWLS
jgi:hypothetical protein